ncbi:MAG: hypothetical protein ABIH23_13410 [bacterium]
MIESSRIPREARGFLVFVLLLGWGGPLPSTADEVTLTNGQKQTDPIVAYRAGKLIVSAAGGETPLPVSAIAGFQVDRKPDPQAAPQDLITFSNGDKRVGRVIGYRDWKLILELDGQEIGFSPGGIAGFEIGVAQPAAAGPLDSRLKPPAGVAEMIQRATGVNTEARTGDLGEDRKLAIVAEKGTSIPVVMMGVVSSSFYGQRGCYIRGTIRNDSLEQEYGMPDYTRIRGYDFVIQVFDANDRFIASQRFYLFRFPPKRAVPFSVHFPYFSWERVAKIRVSRRF